MRERTWLALVCIAGCVHEGQGRKAPPALSAAGRCVSEPRASALARQGLRDELAREAAQDPMAFAFSFPDRVSALVRRNREAFAEDDRSRFLALARLALPDLDGLPDDSRAQGAVAERIRQVIADAAGLDGAATLTRLIQLPTSLFDRFATLRAFALGWDIGPSDDTLRDRLVEAYVAPGVVRLNDDPTHPLLALPRRDDLFVIWFDATGDGALPRRMRWVRRARPAEPDRSPATADEVYRAFSLAMESEPAPRELRGGDLNKYLSNRSETLRKQWLAPHGALLRQHGACAFERLPLQPVPDLSGWSDESDLWAPADLALPGQLWTPEAVFAAVRLFMTMRSQPPRAFPWRALLDQAVRPVVTRGNDDPDHPVLAEIEHGTALVVTLRISDASGYEVASVKYARQANDGVPR